MTRHQAGVLVLHEQATNAIILTERSTQLRHHPGEICFPGGRWEEGDRSLLDTAFRELQEELGIERERVIIQSMLKAELTLSGFLIHSWVAQIEQLSPFQLAPDEVIDVLRIPMRDVRERSNYQEIVIKRNNLEIKTYQFCLASHYVWGATARIMMQLCSNTSPS